MRLTEKGYVSCNIDEDISCDYCPNASLEDCLSKLGQLENLMEKYNIEDVKQLEQVIINEGTGEQSFKEYVDTYVKPYKDIEDELGIDLLTLFKAFAKGSCGAVYKFVQNNYNEEYEKGLIKPLVIDGLHRHPNSNDFELTLIDTLTDEGYIVKLKDYGKTWSLVKEDLL